MRRFAAGRSVKGACGSEHSTTAKVRGRVGVRVLEEERRVGRRLGLRGGDSRAHRVLGLAARRLDELLAQQALPLQKALVPSDALARTRFRDARLVDVRARVV